MVNLTEYDFILVAFSGGKDSTAAFLYLLDKGVAPERIELWHHAVDGHGSHGGSSTLMDWPSTPAYCKAFAKAFHVPLFFSWRRGGFEREMLRNDTATAPISWENPDGSIGTAGGKGPKGTRLKFPQVSADLSVRWCSAYLKIDVGTAAIRNQSRFTGKKTLFISGERADESPGRAKYKVFEPDRTCTDHRTVHRFRPVHSWNEQEVWNIIRRYQVNAHPSYRIGFPRLSCRACIFGLEDQWASLRQVDPAGFQAIAAYETQFGFTIHRKTDIGSRADAGKPYAGCSQQSLIAEAMDPNWNGPIILPAAEWALPAGAFGKGGGPS